MALFIFISFFNRFFNCANSSYCQLSEEPSTYYSLSGLALLRTDSNSFLFFYYQSTIFDSSYPRMLFFITLLIQTSPLFLSRRGFQSFLPFFVHFSMRGKLLQGITRTMRITMVTSTAIMLTRTITDDITHPNQERVSIVLARQTMEQLMGNIRLRKAEKGLIKVSSCLYGLKQKKPMMGMKASATIKQVAKEKVCVSAIRRVNRMQEQMRKAGYLITLVSWKVMILLSFFSLSCPAKKIKLPTTKSKVTQPIARLTSQLTFIPLTLTCIFCAIKAKRHCWLTATARQKKKLLTKTLRLRRAFLIIIPLSPSYFTQNSTFSYFLPLLFFLVYQTGGAFWSCSEVALEWWQRQMSWRTRRIRVERRSRPDMTLRFRAIYTSQSNLGNLELPWQNCSQSQGKRWLKPLLYLRYFKELTQGGGLDIANCAKNEACKGSNSSNPINLYPAIAQTAPIMIPKAAMPMKTYWKVFTKTPQLQRMRGQLTPLVDASTVMGVEQQL